jgi:hypothetical protein
VSRIRTIKPDFWRDEDLSSVSAEAALLAIGLLNHADDEGYFSANPKLIQADIFPLRELSCSPTVLLEELELIGYVRLFSGPDGRHYGAITNFAKHQVINKPTASKIKELDRLPEDSRSPAVELPSGMEGKGKEKEKEKSAEPRFSPLGFLVEAGADKTLAKDWLAVRSKKKLAGTETALSEFLQEVGRSDKSIDEILRFCCVKGWGGFEAAWLRNPRNATKVDDDVFAGCI